MSGFPQCSSEAPLLPSGDTTGTTDTRNINARLANLQPGESLELMAPEYIINGTIIVKTGTALLGPKYAPGTNQPENTTATTLVAAVGFVGQAMVAQDKWFTKASNTEGIEVGYIGLDGMNGGITGPFNSMSGMGIVGCGAHSYIHDCYAYNVGSHAFVLATNYADGTHVTTLSQECRVERNKARNPGGCGVLSDSYTLNANNVAGNKSTTDSYVKDNIVYGASNGLYYMNTGGIPQTNINNSGHPWEAIRIENMGGWWVTDNHTYYVVGDAYYLEGASDAHIIDNTTDNFGLWPYRFVGPGNNATTVRGMHLAGITTDIAVGAGSNSNNRAVIVRGNIMPANLGLANAPIAAPSTATFRAYELGVGTTPPAGASGACTVMFTENHATLQSTGGQSTANAASVTNASNVVNSGVAGDFAQVQAGMSITGTDIPASTFVGTVTAGGGPGGVDQLTMVQSDLATPQNATGTATTILTFPQAAWVPEYWNTNEAGQNLTAMHGNNVTGSPVLSIAAGSTLNITGELGGVIYTGGVPPWQMKVRAVTSGPDTITTADNLILVTTSGATPITEILPDATTCADQVFTIRKSTTSDGSTVTIAHFSSGQTIDGVNGSVLLYAPLDEIQLVSDGTVWHSLVRRIAPIVTTASGTVVVPVTGNYRRIAVGAGASGSGGGASATSGVAVGGSGGGGGGTSEDYQSMPSGTSLTVVVATGPAGGAGATANTVGAAGTAGTAGGASSIATTGGIPALKAQGGATGKAGAAGTTAADGGSPAGGADGASTINGPAGPGYGGAAQSGAGTRGGSAQGYGGAGGAGGAPSAGALGGNAGTPTNDGSSNGNASVTGQTGVVTGVTPSAPTRYGDGGFGGGAGAPTGNGGSGSAGAPGVVILVLIG